MKAHDRTIFVCCSLCFVFHALEMFPGPMCQLKLKPYFAYLKLEMFLLTTQEYELSSFSLNCEWHGNKIILLGSIIRIFKFSSNLRFNRELEMFSVAFYVYQLSSIVLKFINRVNFTIATDDFHDTIFILLTP